VNLMRVALVAACAACVHVSVTHTRTSPIADMLPVDGGAIAYDVAGAGPPVVLIHGGFGDRRMWVGQMSALAVRHRVVRYDLRGYGGSAAPTADYAALPDLLRLLDQLGIQRAVLVGNSMGGSLALDFSLVHPERVSGLVLVASGPSGFPPSEEDRERERQVYRTAAEQGTEAAAELWLQNPMVAVTSRDAGAGPLLRRMVRENRAVWLM
jgi:pimeloyl-ACP methyl ester carboxylesterase